MWRPLERTLTYLAAAHVDLRLFLTGKASPDLPPLRLIGGTGGGDFRAIGEELAGLLREHGGVTRNSRVLDIGCGVGRVALPLTRTLGPEGQYDGFDIIPRAIRWCRRNISSRYPNFRFRRIAVRSSEYSVFGKRASEITFPYPDGRFDCAFAFSLFTHLTAAEMQQYIRESARVLAGEGRLVATFFLLNERSQAELASLPPPCDFPVEDGPCRLASRENPAAAVAIREEELLLMLRQAGFREHRVIYGTWARSEGAVTFQDLVICSK